MNRIIGPGSESIGHKFRIFSTLTETRFACESTQRAPGLQIGKSVRAMCSQRRFTHGKT